MLRRVKDVDLIECLVIAVIVGAFLLAGCNVVRHLLSHG